MNKIIGLERRTGVYLDNPYDNTIIYFKSDSNPAVIGFKGGSVKIKTSLLTKSTGLTVNDLSVIIGSGVNFDYDLTVDPPKLMGVTLTDNKK